ncbi:MAG: hypothetical protein ACE5JX_05230 [Acidobacteriota bacterium]
MSETCRLTGIGIFVVAIVLSAVSVLAQGNEPGRPRRPFFLYHEAPDDPPAARVARDDPEARSAGRQLVRGPFVSVQVNVDALGQNIVGDAANEPSLAVNPTNPDLMVIGWRQFDTVSSNFRQAGWAYSQDGGQSWTFPGILDPGVFRSDPVLDANSGGDIFFQSLDDSFGVQLFKSLDSGLSWLNPVDGFGGDKNWMTVDRTGGPGEGNIYGIWQGVFGCCGNRTVTRSTDAGGSFEPPVEVPNKPSFGTMAVGPNGEVYAVGVKTTFFQDFNTFVVARSTDATDPGSAPSFRGRVVDLGGSMGFGGTPNPDGLLGQATVAVDNSSGPRRGMVYILASVDPPGPDPLDVHLIRSRTRGVFWSMPVRVNDDPVDNGAWQWFGAISVAPNGRLDVVWNDTRNSGQDDVSELTYAWSFDGGRTWSPNVPVSPPFNSRLGWPNQRKIGDYYDLISDDSGANVAYSATFNGEQDVYFVRVFPLMPGS